MPRGGKNHAQGVRKSLRGEKFSRAPGQYISSPPLANFSCTPLMMEEIVTGLIRGVVTHVYQKEI